MVSSFDARQGFWRGGASFVLFHSLLFHYFVKVMMMTMARIVVYIVAGGFKLSCA